MLQYVFLSPLLAKTALRKGIAHKHALGNLGDLYSVGELTRICSDIAKHQRQWIASSYTKNDFFDLVRSMVQVFS